jgi:hypothetical protein
VALDGVPRGDGYRLIVEAFVETTGRARIVTSLLDVRRVRSDPADQWRIVAAQGLTAVEGLYRLRINRRRSSRHGISPSPQKTCG